MYLLISRYIKSTEKKFMKKTKVTKIIVIVLVAALIATTVAPMLLSIFG
jgi:uncharacterized membrane protein YwzB